MPELVSADQVAQILGGGISRASAERIMAVGLLGPVLVVPTLAGTSERWCVYRDFVDALACTPWVPESHPRALVVRLAPMDEVEDESVPEGVRVTGFHVSMSSDQSRTAAVGDWRVRTPERHAGALITASVAGYVTGVWRVRGVEPRPDKRVRFIVEDAPADVSWPYRSHRLVAPPGGSILVINESNWPTSQPVEDRKATRTVSARMRSARTSVLEEIDLAARQLIDQVEVG